MNCIVMMLMVIRVMMIMMIKGKSRKPLVELAEVSDSPVVQDTKWIKKMITRARVLKVNEG
jgi:hypothetical protein